MNKYTLRAIELANEQNERMEGMNADDRVEFMQSKFEVLISLKITTLLRIGYLENHD